MGAARLPVAPLYVQYNRFSAKVKVCNSKKKVWQSGAFSAVPAEAAANVTRAGVMLQEHYNSGGALDLLVRMDYDTAR